MKTEVLEAVFHALIISRILYAISAWGGFIGALEKGRINSLLSRSMRFGYCTSVTTFENLLLKADKQLFRKTQSTEHCLNHLLPAVRETVSVLRDRDYPFSLPPVTFSLYKK